MAGVQSAIMSIRAGLAKDASDGDAGLILGLSPRTAMTGFASADARVGQTTREPAADLRAIGASGSVAAE